MITATAPCQCGLVGDPTGLWGGSVLACSLRERACCSLNTDVEDTVISVLGQHQTVEATHDLALGDNQTLNIARAALSALEVLPGRTPPFHLTANCDVPLQAGLAASTALLAAITGCLLAHLELRLNPYEVAELVQKIECDLLGSCGGFQEAYMTVFGGLNFLDFQDKGGAGTQDAATPFATVEQLEKYVGELPFLVACRADLPICQIRGQAVQSADGWKALAGLARAAKRAILTCDWDDCASLINRSYSIQHSRGTLAAEAEALIAAARGGGADAAKLSGQAVLALTQDFEQTIQALQAAGATHLFFPQPTPGLTVSMELTV